MATLDRLEKIEIERSAKSELLGQLRIDRNPQTTTPRTSWWLLGAGIALLCLAIVWFVGPGDKVFAVRTATAQTANSTQAPSSVLDATGYVTARRQATVSSKVTGKVTEVLIEEGQRVLAGQVLARLDAADVKAQLDLARAQLNVARAQFADLRLLLDQAERDLARQQDLGKQKLISQQTIDDARTLVESRRSRITTQESEMEVAERSVALAQVGLDNTVVRAPFAGVVTVKAAQPGEMVSPISAGGGFTRTGIGTIVDMDSLEIEVEVNEAYIGRVQPGQGVESMLNAYPTWKIPGKVIAIIPTADRSKATVKVRISIEGTKDARIVPDMGARVAFLEPGNSSGSGAPPLPGVLIPVSAIQTQGDSVIVFVLAADRAQARKVTLGQTYSDLRQVLDGLKANERVIVSPPRELKDGDRVKPE